MKTKYKWIEFEEQPNPKRKTTKWKCINTFLEELGDVYWLTTWRQYVFLANFECEFNNRCLRDIADFLEQLNVAQKGKHKAKPGEKSTDRIRETGSFNKHSK